MSILTLSSLTKDNILTDIGYLKISNNRDMQNKNYLSKKVFINSLGISKIDYDKEWHLKQSYIYNTLKIDELNLQCIENNMTPIFITLTLPSEYHATKKKGKNLVHNYNYNPFITVSDGYDRLIDIFRYLYNNFMIDRKKVKGLKFVRVIEPHKNFTPHLHAVVYVPNGLEANFKKHFNNVIKNNELKQVDYKELDSVTYATTYLLKYVQKTLEGDDVVRGWCIHHKINRVLTISNLDNGINREVFKRLSRFVPFDKDSDLNYFRQILQKVKIRKTLLNADNSVSKIEEFGNKEADIFMDYAIKKVREIEFNGTICIDYGSDELYSLSYDNNYLLEEEIEEDIYGSYFYSLHCMKIFISSLIVFDKGKNYIDERGYYYED